MKRISRMLCTALVLLMMLALFACGESSKEIDVLAVKEQIISDLGIEGAMDLEAERLLSLYGIAEEDIATQASFITMGGTFPDEIVLLTAVSKEAADSAEEKLNTRLDAVLVQAQSYSPEDYAIAQECHVLREGNTVALFISKNHAEMEEIFTSSAK